MVEEADAATWINRSYPVKVVKVYIPMPWVIESLGLDHIQPGQVHNYICLAVRVWTIAGGITSSHTMASFVLTKVLHSWDWPLVSGYTSDSVQLYSLLICRKSSEKGLFWRWKYYRLMYRDMCPACCLQSLGDLVIQKVWFDQSGWRVIGTEATIRGLSELW